MGREDKHQDNNKWGGSIKQGGRIKFDTKINGEALIRVSRVEKWFEINKRACPYIKYSRVLSNYLFFSQYQRKKLLRNTICINFFLS